MKNRFARFAIVGFIGVVAQLCFSLCSQTAFDSLLSQPRHSPLNSPYFITFYGMNISLGPTARLHNASFAFGAFT